MPGPVIRYPVPGNKVDTRRPWYVWLKRITSPLPLAVRVQVRDVALAVIYDSLLNTIGGQMTYRQAVRIPADIAAIADDLYTVRAQTHSGSVLTAWSSGTATEGGFTAADEDERRPILSMADWQDLQ